MVKKTTNSSGSLIFKMIKTSLIIILLTLAGSDNISRSSATEIFIGGGGAGILECKGGEAATTRRGSKFAALRHCTGGKGWVFARLPKGGVVPPSGPSRRTNGDHY